MITKLGKLNENSFYKLTEDQSFIALLFLPNLNYWTFMLRIMQLGLGKEKLIQAKPLGLDCLHVDQESWTFFFS